MSIDPVSTTTCHVLEQHLPQCPGMRDLTGKVKLKHVVELHDANMQDVRSWCRHSVGPEFQQWIFVYPHHWLFREHHDAMQFAMTWC
jgi:hypothetical protein